jgi:hypothetical protein
MPCVIGGSPAGNSTRPRLGWSRRKGLGYLIVFYSYHFEIPMMFAAALFAALGGIGSSR